MTLQAKIAERLRSTHTCVCDDAYRSRRLADPDCELCDTIEPEARGVEHGAWDDILGVPSPTIDQVRALARAKFGKHAAAELHECGFVEVLGPKQFNGSRASWDVLVYTPTIESAYRALLALPDKVTP